MVKRVCVVGAGPSGLVSIKSCLENGLQPVCYEMTSNIGGLWNNDERVEKGLCPKAYKRLTTNICKEVSAYTDFPMPKNWPPFFNWKQYLEYFHSYTSHFKLREYIQFNVKVNSITESPSYDETGSWMVHIENLVTGQTSVTEFDAVMVATGSQRKPNYPSYPGMNDVFQGQTIHAGHYESAEDFRGKSVVVVGGGPSGCDLAVDCSTFSENVFLSSRSGFYIIPRVLTGGLPLLMSSLTSRFQMMIQRWMPSWLVGKMFLNMIEERINHTELGVKPKHNVESLLRRITITDELPLLIYSGRVKTRPDIEKFGKNSVTFVDGRTSKADVVVLGTGYRPSYDFLSPRIIPEKLEDVRLYEWIFPFNLKHPSTLSFIGLVLEDTGAANSSADLQSRFVAKVLSGKMKLDSVDQMKRDWNNERQAMLSATGGIFVPRGPLNVYQEQLARKMGVLPSFLRLIFTDPRLAFNFYFGPILPYHYRIVGDNSKPECREYALNAVSNIWNGLRQ
uniref:dimethylaniline monooxygenase [N-oxide-forming] 3 n=1 Tax=Ciona intestinalis TaxID=7719 RepID=UPI00005210B0|nr:dimethylaniline monooxygenase [N-oxide-forming] 3 [Ciona intestinalis]|eukprot:XP_002128325.1 dimethylaniline monooxygenase [N-oxide-forming] 3 [Ciona intestinalis]